jgi:hypothetical protein
MLRVLILMPALLALVACGRVGELERTPAMAPAPVPYGADAPSTADRLLRSDPQAVPERSVELRSESEEREDDPFDLPPEG